MSTSASGRVVEAMEGKLESLCLAKECRACRELHGGGIWIETY